ncbi:MAG: hypothetical protein N3A69_10255, partial [Leptospiraceae bacterium]|nr:hypothetical protein [Leptospiraceae bacterium]
LGLSLKFEKNLVTGNLYSNQSNFLVESGKCPSPDCKLFLMEGFQMNVPIQHDLSLKSERSLLLDEKSKFIQNTPIFQTYNLSLRRIVGSHPFRENTPVEYVKQIGNEPGLKGILEYKQNLFRLENLKINSLNGYIYGKHFFLNLQSFFPNKLEYLATLQVRDIDLRELLKPAVAKRIDDGKITADINISGKNFVDFIENINIFLSVYKLGRDFGKSALNVIMSSNLLQDYLVTSYSVDKIELELSRGLVYANVLFKPGILPTLFLKVENNQISLERMPISNFLSRAQAEIQTYE